jgi:hypothetical protein
MPPLRLGAAAVAASLWPWHDRRMPAPSNKRSLKRPRDPIALAKLIGDIATGQVEDRAPDDGKNPAAVALGRLGGQKGGKARAAKLSPRKRSQIAKKAARTRWAGRG